MRTAVVIVGAGPTGLTTACTLAALGVDVTILEGRDEPDPQPRALVLWAGALEVLDRIGVADDVLAEGLALTGARYLSRGQELFSTAFGSLQGTRFTQPVCLPQPRVQQLLLERFQSLGGAVRWGHRVQQVALAEAHVDVHAVASEGPVTLEASWLVGADGSRSTVREQVGISMSGRTFAREFVLADGALEGSDSRDNRASYHLSPDGVLVVVPLPKGGHRVFADGPVPETPDPRPAIESVRNALFARGDGTATLEEVVWASRFRVHAQVADRFRVGRVLLAGDAAHVHSPAGGQGMNTGIQDGFDLAWRLAASLSGARDEIIEGYEAERRPVAKRAVQQAALQTRIWLVNGRIRRSLRDRALRRIGDNARFQQEAVRRLAQLDLPLRNSPAILGRGVPLDIGLAPVGRRSTTDNDGGPGQVCTPSGVPACVGHTLHLVGVAPEKSAGFKLSPHSWAHVHEDAHNGQHLIWVRPDGVVGASVPWQQRDSVLRLLGATAGGPE